MEYQKTMYDVIVQYGLEVGRAEMFQQASLIEYNRVKFNGISPYPEALDVLRELRGMKLKLAIVTDGPRNKALQRILLARLEDEFDAVVTKDDAGECKPHHAPFRIALRRVHAGAKKTMMVGDSITRDMWGAQRMGMMACHALYGDMDRKVSEEKGGMVKVERRKVLVMPDFRINALKDLPPLAARLMR
jgi:HAD superfamily hydrolase (TIGR01549 family)